MQLSTTQQALEARFKPNIKKTGQLELPIHFAHAFDPTGREVGHWHTNGAKLEIDLGPQAKGMYLLRASLPSGVVRSAKIVQP